MDVKCKKCGKEIDGNSPICMYCGAAVPELNINVETKERMKLKSIKGASTNDTSSLKAFGAILIIIGIIADVISMFMIASSSFEAFNVVTIAGTIMFLIGLALISNC